MSLVGFFSGNDARVACLECFRVWVQVFISAHELSLVVGAAVANNDLGGVFVWHHDGGLWESAPECVRVIWLQWLFQHTRMKVVSDLELVLR